MEEAKRKHPSAFEPGVLILNIAMAMLGAIIGLELITRLGISTNTSIIGALIAILLARIPMRALKAFLDLNRQNLVQTAISGATFGAANAIFLPVGVSWLLGRPDLLIPMWIGATLAAFIDMTMIYWLFDTRIFPAKNPWPPGIATAETLIAAARRGKRAMLLLYGMIAGGIVRYLGIPADIAGVAWIGNIWALTMFGIGLIVRGYSTKLFGVDINKYYAPHGIMIGAGLVALIQILLIISKKRKAMKEAEGEYEYTRTEEDIRFALTRGFALYIAVALILALIGGLYTGMSAGMFVWWFIFAAIAALVSELIVGLSAMHAGWFPAFATALIFLILGVLMGFPAPALGLLVGFTAATGPAFADMGYDLKTGWIIRGEGKDPEFEMQGRKQQYFAELTGLIVAAAMVAILAKTYLVQDLVPPVDRVYVATIQAGAKPEIAKYLIMWAIPGAIVQAIGGPDRQLGILFATGLLIKYPIAGITVLIAIAIRLAVLHFYKEEGQQALYVLGAGLIAGSTLVSFFTSTLRLGKK
ncbi:OPT/YSL family transporter [Thermococcus barophilus]|nr:OPT/YSL family transporter [Thermococcus barophilus]